MRAGIAEFVRPTDPLPPSLLVGTKTPDGVVAAPAAGLYQPPSMDGSPTVSRKSRSARLIHKDVGKKKEGPIALCTGDEHGVVCTDEWLAVTCEACHEQRHPQAPLSRDERITGTRATGPNASRPLSQDEIEYDNKHHDPYWDHA